MTEYRIDADGTERERPPRGPSDAPTGPRPQAPQQGESAGENGRPRGSFAQVAPPRRATGAAVPAAPRVPGSLQLPVDFPFVEDAQNYDPITGRWL